MTLHTARDESLASSKQPKLHALVIGVGSYRHPISGQGTEWPLSSLEQLHSTVNTAHKVEMWLRTEYRNPDRPLGSVELLVSPNEEFTNHLEEPTLENIRKAVDRWLERCSRHPDNIAFWYFAGHGFGDREGTSDYLLPSDFGEGHDLWQNCLDFKGFRSGMQSCKAGTQLFFVDACRASQPAVGVRSHPQGASLLTAQLTDGGAHTSATYYAAAAGRQAYGREDGITFFAEALLTSLNGAGAEFRDGQRIVSIDSLSRSLGEALNDLMQEHRLKLSHMTEVSRAPNLDQTDTVTIHVPAEHELESYAVGSESHALEEAMGYATQAFREYLNKNVVQGVELIYFLSYDIWDGCLVYDGLVRDSVEQNLLDHIRRSFLRRDRLRSKYEKLEGIPAELGAAGQCFKDALDDAGRDPVERFWYIGDLANYPSEYQAYDRLLGLVSCLYIPVLGNSLVPVSPDQRSRPPLGGILMAANRKPYGLRPHEDAYQAGARDFGDNVAAKAEDQKIAERIREKLREPTINGEVHHFLACIGGVYSQKARLRSDFRRIMHPVFAKKVAKTLKGTDDDNRAKAVESIGARITRDLQTTPSKWPEGWRETWDRDRGVYQNDIKHLISSEQEQIELIRSYLLAYAWRDLKLKAREGEDKVIRTALNTPVPFLDPPVTLRKYIAESSRPYTRHSRTPIDTMSCQADMLDNLIDDFRECPQGPFALLLGPLAMLAPTERYMHSMAEIEGLLGSSHQERYLHQLAHSLQVWMLGAWMLGQTVAGTATLRDEMLISITDYFKNRAEDLGPGPWRSLLDQWGPEGGCRLVDLFWGFVAASHDIAAPLQSFQAWSRNFLQRYFGERVVRSLDVVPIRLDVFHDPRFPFYKSAITNYYRSEQRSWLESIFHLGLSSHIDHALAGSLILMGEIAPIVTSETAPGETGGGRGAWQDMIPYFKRLSHGRRSGQSRTLPAEQDLVLPAYLSHAVAFSHFHDVRWRWLHQYPEFKVGEKPWQSIPPEPPFFREVAEDFRMKFSEFPLTYLVALCETLLDPDDGAELAKIVQLRRVQMRPERLCSRTTSSFYVSGIHVEEAMDGPPTMVLELRLWQDHFESEKRVFRGGDFGNLCRSFLASQAGGDWIVNDCVTYERCRISGTDAVIAALHDGWCQLIVDGRQELHVEHPLYEILKMRLRLQHFGETYECDTRMRFAVQLANVTDEQGRVNLYSQMDRIDDEHFR